MLVLPTSNLLTFELFGGNLEALAAAAAIGFGAIAVADPELCHCLSGRWNVYSWTPPRVDVFSMDNVSNDSMQASGGGTMYRDRCTTW